MRRVLLLGALPLIGCAGDLDRPDAAGAKLSADVVTGRTLFESYCAACHQPDGRGTDDGRIPPLASSDWVGGSDARLIRILLHGVRGEIEVLGKTYDLEMPGFGQVLSDTEIAALLSFVRERFIDVGGTRSSVAPSLVGSIRAATRSRTEYWTVEELLRVDA